MEHCSDQMAQMLWKSSILFNPELLIHCCVSTRVSSQEYSYRGLEHSSHIPSTRADQAAMQYQLL